MSDDEIRNGQSEFDASTGPAGSPSPAGESSAGGGANVPPDDSEPRFDVAGAALGALGRNEDAELYEAAARDQMISAELAGMEAVAAELARLAPAQIMNRGRSAGIRSRIVARAAGSQVGRPIARAAPPPLAESLRQTPAHARRSAPVHPIPATSPHAPIPTPASAPGVAGGGRHSNPPRFVPFEPRSGGGWQRIVSPLALAAVLLIAAFGLYNWKTRASAGSAETAATHDSTLEARIATLTATVKQKDSLIGALTGTHTRVIDLIGYNSVDPMARVFWDQKTQMFIMYASHVKQPPTGKTYQVWLIARGVASPVSAGTFMPDSAGSAIMATKHPMEPGTLRRIAVTEEPMGGMPTPTGPIMFTGVGR